MDLINNTNEENSTKLSRINDQPKAELKNFEEQLWHLGKVVGTIRGKFQLMNIPKL